MLTGLTSTTVWDAELDSGTLWERRSIQINALAAGLRVSNLIAPYILTGLNLTDQQVPPPVDDVEDFANKFDGWLAHVKNVSGDGSEGSPTLRRFPRAPQTSPKARLRC
jgi:hypothetical protein